MGKVILFDIDLTLINTLQITAKTNQRMATVLGLTAEDVADAVKSYRETIYKNDFHPKNLIKELAKKWQVDEKKLLGAYWDEKTFRECLYPETEMVLKKLHTKYKLGIFSEGFEDCQGFKLEATQLDKYLETKLIFIRRRKLNIELIESWGEVIVVDDNRETIDYLQKCQQVTPIWLNRKSEEKMVGVRTIHNLEELENGP